MTLLENELLKFVLYKCPQKKIGLKIDFSAFCIENAPKKIKKNKLTFEDTFREQTFKVRSLKVSSKIDFWQQKCPKTRFLVFLAHFRRKKLKIQF